MEEACQNFRTYLHSSGVAEALSSTLLNLYRLNKKPTNPIEFIRQNLPPPLPDTIASLTAELDSLNKDIEKLRKMLPKDLRPQRKVQEDNVSVTTEMTEATTATGYTTATGITETTDGTEVTEATTLNELDSVTEEGSVLSDATATTATTVTTAK